MVSGISAVLLLLTFFCNDEVASFLSRNSKLAHHSSRFSMQQRVDSAEPEDSALLKASGLRDVAKSDAIMSESVMNQRLIDMGSEPIDFTLLKKTIAEWSRPLPKKYYQQPLILVGPSGVGKGRLVKALLKDYQRFFAKIVTHTTRDPRPDEVDGISYNFISKEKFEDMKSQGLFLEWAQVHDNYYGTSLDAFRAGQKSGKITIMEIDVQGARSVKAVANQYGMEPKYLFIAPPAVEKLKQRLLLRGTETPEQVKLRISSAERELLESQVEGMFDHVLVNDDFQSAVNEFFRCMRDWYPALPSAARIRMLQRKLKSIKLLSSPPVAVAVVSDDSSMNVSRNSNGEKEGDEDEEFLEEGGIE